jgi:hypothetical protein
LHNCETSLGFGIRGVMSKGSAFVTQASCLCCVGSQKGGHCLVWVSTGVARLVNVPPEHDKGIHAADRCTKGSCL